MAILSPLFLFKKKEEKTKPRLPPQQRWINHILGWGKEHKGITPNLPQIPRDKWMLNISGLVEKPLSYTWEEFTSLPQTVSVSDFHCVETWSVKDQKWEGVQFKTILDQVEPRKNASFVYFEAYDTYTTSLPLNDLLEDDVLLAHKLNDENLSQPLGGPMRLIVPNKYGYKSIMWLHKIILAERDKLGYWERQGYHNSANPWRNQRYTRCARDIQDNPLTKAHLLVHKLISNKLHEII
jgi:DMSO/TMAO reductase YedYZ molybdopterin-dependent catalytic subunit